MKRPLMLILLFIILLVLAFIMAMCMGKYSVTPLDSLRIIFSKTENIPEMSINVVLGLRLPRILASMLIGAALSVSGTVYQSVFRNPLVSPDYLGVTGGATVGAAAAILLSMGTIYISLFAFIGGIGAMMLTMLIPVLLRNNANVMLVMAGIIVGAAMSSILGFLKYIADSDSQLASIVYWTMGSFSYISMSDLLVAVPIILIPILFLMSISYQIDILSIGEDEAKTLGVNVTLVRTLVLLSATLITACSVCLAGTIGWVGLIIPHLGRLLVGPSTKRLIPLAAVTGALFLLIVDTVTRTISTTEMPVSILTGALGVPFYCWLLYKQRKELI
ncbi:MAG: iron ABC transporter permease [Oscillospiraceae bacterium]|nr:iron ABC transporter permease [Oscillospiraceae bacterium]